MREVPLYGTWTALKKQASIGVYRGTSLIRISPPPRTTVGP